MSAPTREYCLSRRLPERCDRTECTHYIPPVAGDLLRRNATCARAISDLAFVLEGLDVQSISWLLGLDDSTVYYHQAKALTKLRKRVQQ